MMSRSRRARDYGIPFGSLEPGPANGITDVKGVMVGQTTLISGDGTLVPGKGPIRTGVTVILPHPGNVFRNKVPAVMHSINGFGKCFGQEQVDEFGEIESPIALTGTMNAARVADALISYGIRENPDIGIRTTTINAVVGECSDQVLNDMQGRHVRDTHVLAAIDNASFGPVEEGAVGAGTGMSCYGFKGGIGTASRKLPHSEDGWTVGMLVLANFGRKEQLTIAGVPVGRMLIEGEAEEIERGSIMFVLATDAPLLDRGLKRLARRCAHGLARTGSISGNTSGDFVIGFSTTESCRKPHGSDPAILQPAVLNDHSRTMDALFQAVVEATEEAIINALFASETMTGRDGNKRVQLPITHVVELLRDSNRLLV